MSYAAIHRIAVREALRVELAQACGAIERATHKVVDSRNAARYYWYGSLAECEDFARGLWECRVAPMTHDDKEVEKSHKCKIFRALPGWR